MLFVYISVGSEDDHTGKVPSYLGSEWAGSTSSSWLAPDHY